MEFVGRSAELAVLERALRSKESSLIPIYGRRRVGKSELILHFLQGQQGLYFVGKKGPAALQIREFLTQAALALDEPLLATFPAEGWSAAFDAVTSHFRGRGKLILALDEFQWTAEASPEILSVLQAKWDREWSKSGRMLLILCGSFIGFMEREILGKKSPLFGRRSAQILLRPFSFEEAALFHPSYSPVDCARTYFLCGGLPFYLKRFSDRRSVEQNLREEFLDDSAPLYREADFLLREELREVENYYAILLALASGSATGREIADRAGLDPRGLFYYLEQLATLGYVERRYPLSGEKPTARQVRFELSDPLLRFWFRFVYSQASAIRLLGPERALRELITPRLDSYFGLCFERLCREALASLYRKEGVTAAFELGEYWSKEVQIDVVGLRSDGVTDLGECKWGAAGSASALAEELEAKVRAYPNRRGATLGRRIFTRQAKPRAAAKLTGIRWHSLADLYES